MQRATSRQRSALPFLVVFLASFGCSGGGGSGAGARSSAARGGQGADNVSIGDLASSQGGLASLGGAGNREGSAPSAVVTTFRADLVEKGAPVKVDGVLGEWPARIAATQVVGGGLPGTKTAFASALQYDDAKLYVAGEVTDVSLERTPRFESTEDHASLVLAFPTGGSFAAYEIGLFAGNPGESPGEVRWMVGGKGEVPGAKIVEAQTSGGYTFEASIPWSTFPEARTLRVGLRGAARYYDADSRGMRTVLATGQGGADSPGLLPWLPLEPEQSVIEGLLIPKQLSQTPRAELYADVAGDAMKERIAVYDRYFTICGPAYRGGKEFFFRDLGAELLKLDARDVSGRGKDDSLVRRKFTTPGGARERFEVWSVTKTDEPVTVFAHEIAITSGTRHVTNAVHVGPREIEVAIEPAAGWDASNFKEPMATDVEPILLPWGGVKSHSFKFDGAKFAKSKEATQGTATDSPPGAAVARADKPEIRPAEPPTPHVKPGLDPSKQLFGQYLQDRSLPGDTKPRFDLQVHVDGDARPERVVLVGRDLVVFGPGFRGGNEYATISLQQFSDPADIKDVTARDLTGDGAADLVVRGIRHVTAASSPEAVDLEATFIYQLKSAQLVRIFGIETARDQGGKRVQGLVQFVPSRSGKSFDIDVRPGVAKGWTEKTYPWQQEKPGGALEPLLLPWGGIPSLRYTWNGSAFTP